MAKYYILYFVLFIVIENCLGQVNEGSSKHRPGKRTQFELDFDLPQEAPTARRIHEQENIPSAGPSNSEKRPTFDSDLAIKEFAQYDEINQKHKVQKSKKVRMEQPVEKVTLDDFEGLGSKMSSRK